MTTRVGSPPVSGRATRTLGASCKTQAEAVEAARLLLAAARVSTTPTIAGRRRPRRGVLGIQRSARLLAEHGATSMRKDRQGKTPSTLRWAVPAGTALAAIASTCIADTAALIERLAAERR